MRTRKPIKTLVKWGVFLALCAALTAVLWVAWSLVNRGTSLPGITPVQSDSKAAVGLIQAPGSLDIRTQSGDPVEQALLENVYETIVMRNSQNGLRPGLASAWKVSADGLTYTFTMRESMHFSNGDVLDGADVVWSLQQIIGKHYLGYDQLGDIKQVSNPNAQTVIIALNKPNPLLLRALSGRAGIVYDHDASIDYATEALGSGPFTVASYQRGSSMLLKRNDSYWSDPADSSEIQLRYYSDETTMMNDLKDGTIQMAVPVSATAAKEAEQYPTLKVSEGASTSKMLLAFNSDADSPFSDRRIRQATRSVIDTNAIVHGDADAAQKLGGPISPLEPGYEDLTGLYPFDLAKGTSLLSYYSTHYLGTLTFLVPSGSRALGETVAQQLSSNTRFTVDMQVVSESQMLKRMQQGDYTIALMNMDETGDASMFAKSNSIFHYENADAQAKYAEAITAQNDATYQAKMKDYAKILSEDAAADWLFVRKINIVSKVKLEGYPTNLTTKLLPLNTLMMH